MESSGKRYRSIQTKFFLLLLVTLLPILFIQGYIYYDRFTAIREEEFQANTEVARAVAVAFDSFVRDIIHQELAIAIAATASPPLSPADLKRLLEQSSKEMSDIPLHLLGPYGRILASSRPDAIGLDLSDRPFFKEIASGREWFVSDLNISELTGEPEITISRGIRNADGDLLGLAVAVVELSHAAQQKESSFLSGIMETIMSVPDYQILAKLAEAPQSAVFKAYHKKNPDRPLVLKILKARSLSEARKAHFVQRIEHLRILHDPLVITPISFESKDEVFFLTQEFFSEITLDKWLEDRSRIPLNDFLEMACALARALDRVHQAGIIHGGIKPQLRSLPGGGQANEL